MEVTLLRASQRLSDPQFGVLLIDGMPRLLTLELPWKDNLPTLSCIPEGEYLCNRRKSSKTNSDYTYEVLNVPERSGVLFHWGNTTRDTEGCILVGNAIGSIGVTPVILDSKSGFLKFMAFMQGAPQFQLNIKRAL